MTPSVGIPHPSYPHILVKCVVLYFHGNISSDLWKGLASDETFTVLIITDVGPYFMISTSSADHVEILSPESSRGWQDSIQPYVCMHLATHKTTDPYFITPTKIMKY